MTVIAAQLKRGGLLFPFPASRGVSPAANQLREIVDTTVGDLADSLAVRETAQTGIGQLKLLEMTAGQPNWDGYGASAVNRRSLFQAVLFIKALPTTIPAPEISADPDGEVDLSWHFDTSRTLSISIGPTGRLAYSALIGDVHSYGTEWISNEIPQTILFSLSRVLRS
jgi:hypothetical protein